MAVLGIDQEPMLRIGETKCFMLDELGNLQSEGHGISSFQTMLSIGLGYILLILPYVFVMNAYFYRS